MTGALRRRFADGRWHFQHGPIDCIVWAEGGGDAVARCVERAWRRFDGLLEELVGELPLLRADLAAPASVALEPRGSVARRMVAACRPHSERGTFITSMAAVAGSVAEELIDCFDDRGIARSYVNNGGDIALHLTGDASFEIGVFGDPSRAMAGQALDATLTVDAMSPVRGVATSGWRGRSLSLGIADAVTVLAASASSADAAATVIANAVDVQDDRIDRRPASRVRDDSDLGDRLVTCGVPSLPQALIELALERGREAARREIAAGRIVAALLLLQGRSTVCGEAAVVPATRPLAVR